MTQCAAQSTSGVQKLLGGLLALSLGFPCGALAGFTGEVVGVSAGDSVTVLVGSRLLRVHLRDVDAPEEGQPFGARARESLAEICHDSPALIDDLGIDRDRRVIGDVECAGVDAGAEQVRRGMAWVFERSAPEASPLRSLQTEAKSERRGLWGDAAPIPPWKWPAAPR